MKRWMTVLGALLGAGLWMAGTAHAEDKARYEIYGFVMTDVGYNSKAIDPAWFDVQRPTKLESFDDEFGDKGSTFFSVRQTRFGMKSWIPTDMGELKTTFEWELFGSGADAGKTTLRLRHAYGELGKFGAGQYNSTFYDGDVFPNILEYWGPNGMVLFRNIQLRYMPIQGDTRLTIALERPGASADQGLYADRIELSGVVPRFPVPDLTANYHLGRPWGYVQLSGIVRRIDWEDVNNDAFDLAGGVTGWGGSLSSNLKAGKDNIFRLELVHGEGIENYMNDAPEDVGAKPQPGNLTTPVTGEALPMTGATAFLDHNWNAKWTSSVGYSQLLIENSAGQLPDAFHMGKYAIANLLYTPAPKVLMGIEGGWDQRMNNTDGFKVDNYHVQASFKYSFNANIGGE